MERNFSSFIEIRKKMTSMKGSGVGGKLEPGETLKPAPFVKSLKRQA
jgi:hypothetical protein